MTRPIALLIGNITHAKKEWQVLEEIADLKEITSGTRESILADFKAGKHDGVVAIYRTFDSAQFTGRFDKELISTLPSSLKFLCHNGAGYDQIDIEPCSQRGIFVAHTPTAVDAATSNIAIMLLLQTLRRSYQAESSLRNGKWRGDQPLGHDPDGKILGILGMGGIGTALAVRAVGFGMNIVYHNRKPVPDEANPTGARYIASFEEFLGTCDIISVHLPLTEKTRHYIGAREFGMCKNGVIIVNTARGPVIDENALVQALESGKVGGAGLDVFEEEPKIHPGLMGRNDCILFPHLGTFTYESQHKMESLVINNVRSAIEKGALLTMVPEQKGKIDEIKSNGRASPKL